MTANIAGIESYNNQAAAYNSRKMTASVSEKNFGQTGSRIERFDESKYEKQEKSQRRLNSASKKVKGIK